MIEIEAVLHRYLPSQGSPPPSPRLDPDPTLQFRQPDDLTEAPKSPRYPCRTGRSPPDG